MHLKSSIRSDWGGTGLSTRKIRASPITEGYPHRSTLKRTESSACHFVLPLRPLACAPTLVCRRRGLMQMPTAVTDWSGSWRHHCQQCGTADVEMIANTRKRHERARIRHFSVDWKRKHHRQCLLLFPKNAQRLASSIVISLAISE
jgi:hypothetical protein